MDVAAGAQAGFDGAVEEAGPDVGDVAAGEMQGTFAGLLRGVVFGELAGALDQPGFLGVGVFAPLVPGDFDDFKVVAPDLDGFLDLLFVGDVDPVPVGAEANEDAIKRFGAFDTILPYLRKTKQPTA